MKIVSTFVVVALSLQIALSENDFKTEDSSDFRRFGQIIGAPHIAGGAEVKPHSLPYQVALFHVGREQFCGGALIADQWVLTAAHCLLSGKPIWAGLGVHDLESDKDQYSYTLISVDKAIPHENFSTRSVRDDIAVLKLGGMLGNGGKKISPIRLPKASQKSWAFWNYEVVISGWGSEYDRYSPSSQVLKSVSTRVSWNFYCKMRFYFNGIKYYGDTHICTSGSGAKGSCFGDSGGPLTLVENDGNPTVIGIASYLARPTCDTGTPSAFTRVTNYLGWIQEKTGIPLRA